VTARLGTPAGDDVRAVRPVLADRPQELPTTDQRLAERGPESTGRLPVESVRLATEVQEQSVVVDLDTRRIGVR
jgi:hypothetical protein